MLDHLDDLWADILAIWGVDIHRASTSELTGPEFFAMAMRTFAFEGVMQARLEQERQEGPPARQPVPEPRQQAPGSTGSNVVELNAFRAEFPDLVSHSTEGR